MRESESVEQIVQTQVIDPGQVIKRMIKTPEQWRAPNQFAADLRAWRHKHQVSLRGAGQLLGINRRTIEAWEQGRGPGAISEQLARVRMREVDERERRTSFGLPIDD